MLLVLCLAPCKYLKTIHQQIKTRQALILLEATVACVCGMAIHWRHSYAFSAANTLDEPLRIHNQLEVLSLVVE
jgi:hypothetical protein